MMTSQLCACGWQEERLRRGDDLRLQMAIEESRREKTKPEVCVCGDVCVCTPTRGLHTLYRQYHSVPLSLSRRYRL